MDSLSIFPATENQALEYRRHTWLEWDKKHESGDVPKMRGNAGLKTPCKKWKDDDLVSCTFAAILLCLAQFDTQYLMTTGFLLPSQIQLRSTSSALARRSSFNRFEY